jgi:hypothetical protein
VNVLGRLQEGGRAGWERAERRTEEGREREGERHVDLLSEKTSWSQKGNLGDVWWKKETKENPFALAEPHWGRSSIDAVAFAVSVPEFKNVSSWKSNANASPFIREIWMLELFKQDVVNIYFSHFTFT